MASRWGVVARDEDPLDHVCSVGVGGFRCGGKGGGGRLDTLLMFRPGIS